MHHDYNQGDYNDGNYKNIILKNFLSLLVLLTIWLLPNVFQECLIEMAMEP